MTCPEDPIASPSPPVDPSFTQALVALAGGDGEAIEALHKHAEDADAAGLLETLGRLHKAPEVAWIVAAFAARSTTLEQAAREAGRLVRLSTGDTPLSAGLRYAAVVWALDREGGEEASESRARAELENELHRRLVEFSEEIGEEAASFADSLPLEGQIFVWDERFAAQVERLGENGRERAQDIRQKAAGRRAAYERGELKPIGLMRLWFPPEEVPAPRFVAALAVVLWRDVVLPRLKKPAALAYPIMNEVVRIHSRTFRQEQREGQRVLLFEEVEGARLERITPLQLPACEVAVLDAIIHRGLDLLGSVTAHKLLRWEVAEGHRRVLRGETDARALRTEGGWSGIAEALGLKGRRRAEELHAIVATQAHCAFLLPHGGYGNLLSYEVIPARGRRPGQVTIVLGDALLPHYIFEIRKTLGDASRSSREAQRLVPMVDLPPFVGRDNEHGQQATFSLVLVSELRARSRELVEQGSVLLALPRLAELADRAGLPRRLLVPVIERWTRDGDDAPAFLERTGRNRYILGAAHGPAMRFLLEAGKKELEAGEAGRRSVVNRERAARRRGT